MANPLHNPAVTPAKVRRFRTNPVELAIFSVITLVFFNSVYNLFYDQQGFHPTALRPMAANPISEGGTRSPASATQAFVNIDVKCDSNADQDTLATKVRVTGALCGAGNDTSKLIKAVVVNNANKFNATVFTDVNAGKISTDYIPLNMGKNPIHIEFSYRDGKTVMQDINVVKN